LPASWANTEADAQILVERVQRLQSWGYPSRVIGESDIRRLEPNLEPGKVIVAKSSEIEGQVEPNLVVATCLELVTRAGAVTRYETAVTGYRPCMPLETIFIVTWLYWLSA